MGRTELSDIDKRRKINQELPDSLGGTIKKHRKWKKMTQSQLAENTLLSADTISRIEKGEIYEPKLETVMAIIVGLKLDYWFSFDILSKCGYLLKFGVLQHIPKIIAYQKIIAFEGKYSVRDVNQMLEAQGIAALTLCDE